MTIHKDYFLRCDSCGRLICADPDNYRRDLDDTISHGIVEGWYVVTTPMNTLATEVESFCPDCWNKMPAEEQKFWERHALEFAYYNASPLTKVSVPERSSRR